MLWKDLLWRLVTGISTSEFLLNSGIFFSALIVGRKWTNYQEPFDLLKRIHHLILLFWNWLSWKVERKWAYLFGCAKNIVYLRRYKYTRDVWGDWIIGHSHCILPSYFNAILSLSNLKWDSACFCRDKFSSLCTFAQFYAKRSLSEEMRGLYTVSLYDMICVNCRQ